MRGTNAPVKFTSQCGEDKWIAANWQRLGLPKAGFFVEFGAANGVASSNTYWLEKSKGWRGLLCEPDPRHEIKDRPNSIVERCAIGPTEVVSFGLDANDPCLSGVKRSSDDRIELACIPLADLLSRHQIERVDLISIDTEGTELEAWRTLELARWRPRVAILEFVSWGISDRTAEIIPAMRDDGYKLVKQTRLNGIFKDTQQ